jgi:hypothetical protein
MRQRLLLLSAALVLFSSMPVVAQNGTKVGLLSCKMGPSVGLIVGSASAYSVPLHPGRRRCTGSLLRLYHARGSRSRI